MQQFTFYWRDGKREVLPGESAPDCLNKAGYGHGAVAALDFWCDGCDHEWEWDETTREWKPTPDSPLAKQIASAKAAQTA